MVALLRILIYLCTDYEALVQSYTPRPLSTQDSYEIPSHPLCFIVSQMWVIDFTATLHWIVYVPSQACKHSIYMPEELVKNRSVAIETTEWWYSFRRAKTPLTSPGRILHHPRDKRTTGQGLVFVLSLVWSWELVLCEESEAVTLGTLLET